MGTAIPDMNNQPCGSSTGLCIGGMCTCTTAGEGYNPATGLCATCPTPDIAGTFYVDADPTVGTDNVCCGRHNTTTAGWGAPCLTATQALSLATAVNSTIWVTSNAIGSVSPLETYPIELSNGVAVISSACFPGAPGVPVFSVDTDGSATSFIRPGAVATVRVGACSGAATEGNPSDGIFIGTSGSFGGGFAVISGVVYGIHINGGTVSASSFEGLTVSGGVTDGLHMESTGTAPSSFMYALTVTGASRYDVFVGNHSSATTVEGGFALGQNPGGGAPVCGTPQDQVGIHVEADGKVNVARATINCFSGNGIELVPGSGGAAASPSVTIGGSAGIASVTNCGCIGADVEAGSFTSSGVTYTSDHWGVVAASANATVNLSGATTPNIFGCFSDKQPGACNGTGVSPGFGIWNNSTALLNADSNQWSVSPPSACTCDDKLMNCTCTGLAGPPTTPPDGALIVSSPLLAGGAAPMTNAANPSTSSQFMTCP
jgi:hypothetical protein